jgi:hypothetical protein
MSALPGIATTLLQPAGDLIAFGVRTERQARAAAAHRAGELAVGMVEAALASPATEQAVERILDSPLLERALARAMSGTLVEGVARDIARYAVIERLTEQLLAEELPERIATAALESPAAARLVDRVLESPEAERLVGRVIESRLVDATVARLLESKDLWLLVDEVAKSPSVRAAISDQGLGFAEEVAGVVRDRSRSADARVERLARRLFRREASNGHE